MRGNLEKYVDVVSNNKPSREGGEFCLASLQTTQYFSISSRWNRTSELSRLASEHCDEMMEDFMPIRRKRRYESLEWCDNDDLVMVETRAGLVMQAA
jgi:hypothetical protein